LFQICDQLLEDVRVVIDVSQSGIASVAQPAPEMAVLVTRVEMQSSAALVRAGTHFTQGGTRAPRESLELGTLFGLRCFIMLLSLIRVKLLIFSIIFRRARSYIWSRIIFFYLIFVDFFIRASVSHSSFAVGFSVRTKLFFIRGVPFSLFGVKLFPVGLAPFSVTLTSLFFMFRAIRFASFWVGSLILQRAFVALFAMLRIICPLLCREFFAILFTIRGFCRQALFTGKRHQLRSLVASGFGARGSGGVTSAKAAPYSMGASYA
jgi:hypothetical protein